MKTQEEICSPPRPKLHRVDSPLETADDDPLFECSLAEAFTATAEKFPNHTAIIDEECRRESTFREVDSFAKSIAAGLQARGIRKGDRVATSLGNTLEGCVVRLWCLRLEF